MRKLFTSLLAALVMVAAAPSAEARRVWPIYGARGDGQVTLDCPEHEVLAGFGGRTGSNIDQVFVLCKPLNADGTFGSAHPASYPAGGTGGGQIANVTCPQTARMHDLTIRLNSAGKQVVVLEFTCREPSGAISEREFSAQQYEALEYTTTRLQSCPQEHPVALGVTFGRHINGAGLVCDSVDPVAPTPRPITSSGKARPPSGPPVASALALAGAWQTVTNQNGHFTVILQINNPSLNPLLYDLYVTGQMINSDGAAEYNGTLQGVIPKGTRTLQYSYVQQATNSSGTGQFTLSQDGNSITGSGKAGDADFTWNGTRAK